MIMSKSFKKSVALLNINPILSNNTDPFFKDNEAEHEEIQWLFFSSDKEITTKIKESQIDTTFAYFEDCLTI